MNIAHFSIRNPLVVAALAISLALFGIYSYLTLGVSVVPSVSFPEVTVTTTQAAPIPTASRPRSPSPSKTPSRRCATSIR